MEEQLQRATDIQGYELGAQDGKIGMCHDFLFSDQDWVIRYIVADTRKWLPGRKVLISPISLGAVDRKTNTLNVGLTQEQIQEAPPLDADAPVSRKYEMILNKYYDWGNYWDGALVWGPHAYPRLLKRPETISPPYREPEKETHLRSVEEVIGYEIQAQDTTTGKVVDFLLAEETWVIRYLVVDMSGWLSASKWIIVSPQWVDMVDWNRQAVVIRLTNEQIKNGPQYDPSLPIDRAYEKRVYDYYGVPYYW